MLMRNTSAPASNNRAMTAWSEEAGPSVARTLVRRCRLIAVSWSLVSAGRRGWGLGAGAGRRRGQRTAGRQWLGRRLLGGFGELHRPGALLGGVHFEEPSPVITMGETVADAADRELLVARAHVRASGPLAAMVVIDSVNIIKARDEIAFEHGLAASRRQIPPAFRGPAVGVLV